MSEDKLKGHLDGILGRALQKHSEPVPPDFTDRILSQIREAKERRILARVLIEERLALAGCIVLGIIAIAVATAFPNVAGSLTEQTEAFVDKISQVVETTVSCEWQFYMVFDGVFGFAVYSLVDLLVGDS